MTTVENYKLYKTLGEGAFSKVKLVKDEHGSKFAMKIMKNQPKDKKKDAKATFLNEVFAMKELDHPNILKLVDYNTDAKAIRADGSKLKLQYMAIEYAEGGELFDFISDTGRFSEEHARYFYHQLIDALEHMHEKGYKHRDIKPENILLDKKFQLKLGDFGFATKEEMSHTRKGTYGYMAPEVLAKQPYRGEEADLFASAVILFILVTEHPPFLRAETSDRYYKLIASGRWEEFWDIDSDLPLSKSFIDFFTRMVSLDPVERMTLSELKAHEWFNGPVPSDKEIYESFKKRRKIIKKNQKKDSHDKKKDHIEENKAQYDVKYTKFYVVDNAETLVDYVVACAEANRIDYEKSKEFFRVEVKINSDDASSHIMINVLKKPENADRCLEFIKISGSKTIFESLFAEFKEFCDKEIKNPVKVKSFTDKQSDIIHSL
ncbi:unnamed protein product [Moneuplotes crassus]|uniref:Protein kinase domain-containing protein n=2 Tax=Euplotes crassus TaxID=5936 RepID=A0AAD1XB04_EUPCR|nr:unnamed protein product [Moneuplotes crassus]